jgi:hypothetical protein
MEQLLPSTTEMHIAEPLAAETIPFEVEIATENLITCKSPGFIQISAELILSGIHNPVHSIWNREELPKQWNESLIVPVHKGG